MLFFEKIIIGIFVVLQTTIGHLDLYLNDKCSMDHSNDSGICQYVEDCPIVEQLFRKHHINPTLCGFERNIQIVCCPKNIETRFSDNATEVNHPKKTISSQKCIEYQNLCSESTSIDWESDQITAKTFPFMAAIGIFEQKHGREDRIVWSTGGVLISKNFVLLTTKRLKNNSPHFNRTAKYIRLGITDLTAHLYDSNAQQFDIAEIFFHPLRQQNIQYDRYNDIALIRIVGEVMFSESIRPACLAQPESMIAHNLLVIGWGQIDLQGTIKMDLQKIRFNLVSHPDCETSYKFYNPSNLEQVIVNETQICARSETSKRDACQGFSGGPLINTIGKPMCLFEVIGIKSLGLGCGARNPGVFTRVSAYLNWIENIVWPEENEKSINSTTKTIVDSSLADQTTRTDEIVERGEFNTSVKYTAWKTISAEKCAEYQKLCSKSTALRWEGDQIAPKEFPYMAAIGLLEQRPNEVDKIIWFTGGTLISKNFVLSTTKRLGSNSPHFNRTAKYIRLGITELTANINDTNAQQFNIVKIFFHPLRQNTRYNDIALFKMDGLIEFSESIRPACLAQPESMIADNLIVTGWGHINSKGLIKMDLQKLRFILVSHTDCDASYKFHNPSNLERGIDNETQICARSETRERDACQGFGGAPLINTIEKPSCLYEVVGLTSLGIGCGTGNPGVFTRVSAYLDWIENIVWLNS